MASESFRHRGLRYRRDAPFDRDEGSGTLAEDVVLDGVKLVAGTGVWRDIDIDTVWAQLVENTVIRGFEAPAGAIVELLRAKPRGLLESLMRVLIGWPTLLVWFLVVGTAELLTGVWKPWQRRGEGRAIRRSPTVALVRPRTPMVVRGIHLSGQDGTHVLVADDGSLEVIRP